MFLTKFEVNTARRGAKVLLGSPQAMHAAVLGGFPAGEAGRVLWRLDSWAVATYLYLLTESEPDLTHLVEQAGWPTTATWQTRDYQPVLDRLAPGQRYGFRLTANPTRSTRVHEGKRSQRVGHVTAEQQLGWFLGRANDWGITVDADSSASEGAGGEAAPGAGAESGGDALTEGVAPAGEPSVRIVARSVDTFRRQDAKVTIARATFEGVLTVVDPEALRAAITTGIGPAKAYGCGLLTLAPAGDVR